MMKRLVVGKRVTRAELERYSDTDLSRELMLRRWDRMAKAPTTTTKDYEYKDANTSAINIVFVVGEPVPNRS